MDECPTISWFNLAEIRGDSRWSIYQGKESDPYGQGCGRRKRNFVAAIGWFQVQGPCQLCGSCLLQAAVHASVEVRCVVSPRGEDHNPGGH